MILCLTFVQLKAQEDFNVKLGVMLKSGDKIDRLKSRDRAKTGDKIRIFVNPSVKSYSYVFYSESEKTYLVNDKFIDYSANIVRPLQIPSATEYIEFDGASENIGITIITSKERIPSLDNLFKKEAEVATKEWKSVIDHIKDLVKTDLSMSMDKPISMAGNVRDAESSFISKLQSFSGEKIIIKDYTIEIKK